MAEPDLRPFRFPRVRTEIRETWLSRAPEPMGFLIAALSMQMLVLGSAMNWVNFAHAADWMIASRASVFTDHQWWRAWTTVFAHADAGHLLSNMMLFFAFASLLTAYFGTIMFPFAAFFAGGLVNLIVLASMRPETQLLGASGVVFWMGGVWLTLYGLIDRRRSLTQRWLRAVGVGLLLFFPGEAFDPSISYQAHAVGFGLGVVWGVLYYLKRRAEFLAAEVVETVVDDEDDGGDRDFGGHLGQEDAQNDRFDRA